MIEAEKVGGPHGEECLQQDLRRTLHVVHFDEPVSRLNLRSVSGNERIEEITPSFERREFSAGWTATIASQFTFVSITFFRDLQDLHTFEPAQTPKFRRKTCVTNLAMLIE